jgi:hypothetical protein
MLDLDYCAESILSQAHGLDSSYSAYPDFNKALDTFSRSFRFYRANRYITQGMHLNLITHYCKSNGLAYQAISDILKIPNQGNLASQSILMNCKCTSQDSPILQLNNYGYTKPLQLLSSDQCNLVLKQLPCLSGSVLLNSGKYKDITSVDLGKLDQDVVLVNIPIRNLLRNAVATDIILDKISNPLLLDSWTRYRMKLVSGRLSISFRNSYQKDEAAQSWHFDLDGIGFLKQFIYLNDVTTSNGAHCYIPCTHLPGAKSDYLLRRGYSRITDDEMARYQSQTPHSITGKAGTGFWGSTLCWHKGGAVHDGYRVIMILEYSVSKFQLNVK